MVLGLVIVAALLAFSRYGDLKLGDEDEEPEFSVASWFAMLFAAGISIGLVFWGWLNPSPITCAPPPGITANTPEAANAAMRYSFFHWGLHPWAVYSVVALSIAFFVSARQAGLDQLGPTRRLFITSVIMIQRASVNIAGNARWHCCGDPREGHAVLVCGYRSSIHHHQHRIPFRRRAGYWSSP